MAVKSRAAKSASALAAEVAGATVPSSRSRSSRVSAQATARMGLIAGLVEGTLVIMELMFGLSLVKSACQTVYRSINSVEAEDIPHLNSFCIHLTANIVVLTWLVFRMSQKHQPTVSIAAMADKLHLWPMPRSLSRDSLKMIATIFCLHFVGTLGMLLSQYLTGNWLFSFENYFSEEKGFNYIIGADMLLLAPLREELTFRGVLFTIFYLRGVAFKVAPKAAVVTADSALSPAPALPAHEEESLAWTASWKLDCVLASAACFGIVHLLNLFGDKYTRTYIILQVFLGMTLGAFYCLRFVLSENALLETIILHMINNFFSSFLPIERELDLTDPLVIFPLMLTFVVYGTLCYKQVQKLFALPAHPFPVLQSETPAAAPAAAAVDELKEQ